MSWKTELNQSDFLLYTFMEMEKPRKPLRIKAKKNES